MSNKGGSRFSDMLPRMEKPVQRLLKIDDTTPDCHRDFYFLNLPLFIPTSKKTSTLFPSQKQIDASDE